MNRNTVTLVLFAFIAVGCGSARLVEKTPTGGIIALEGDKDKAWEEANEQIADHCGEEGHHIVREGEHVVGEKTEYGERTQDDKKGTSTGGEVTTSDVTEWRVEYMCGEPTPEPAAEEPAAEDKSPSAKFAEEEAASAPAEEAASAPANESPSAKRAREEQEAMEKKKEAAGDE